jgi:Cu2+-exporting ATPase
VRAGTLNLTGSLVVEATAAEAESFLAEMVRLMEAAEGGRARYRRIADRTSALYAPVVHLTALATFIGWMLATGDWHRAVTVAIAVLIITCPCALGLAVPIVQVVAARRLFERGIMVRDGSAMERMAEADYVVFDKTGTLTLGAPRLVDAGALDPRMLALAGALAARSRHPLSRAIAEAAGREVTAERFEAIEEHAGCGVEGRAGGAVYRLGRAEWALNGADGAAGAGTGVVLARDGALLARFAFEDEPRPEARQAAAELSAMGLKLEILSGDREGAVAGLALALGIGRFRAGIMPAGKAARIA